jgi:hypothetical protein
MMAWRESRRTMSSSFSGCVSRRDANRGEGLTSSFDESSVMFNG